MPTYRIAADPAVLLQDIRQLLGASTAFCDEQLGLCRCLLAAAAHEGLTETGEGFDACLSELRNGTQEDTRALIDLLHGQQITLGDVSRFFGLFSLAERMKVNVCQDICKTAVSDGTYQSPPVRLQISAEQGRCLRKTLLHYRRVTDASIFVAKAGEASDSREWEEMRVHAAVVAASCEFLRGLWTGGFSEAAGSAEARVEDPEDGPAVKALVQLMYGETVEILNEQELVRLFCLADRWQCGVAQQSLLSRIEQAVTLKAAVEILGQNQQLPFSLSLALIAAIKRETDKDEWIGDMGSTRTVLGSASLTAASRLLEVEDLQADLHDMMKRQFLYRFISSSSERSAELALVDPRSLGSALKLLNSSQSPPTVTPPSSFSTFHLSKAGNCVTVSCQYSTSGAGGVMATFRIFGPATVRFTKFSVDNCRLLVKGNWHTGKNTPPVVAVKTGNAIEVTWNECAAAPSRTHSRYGYSSPARFVEWAFTVSRPDFDISLPSPKQMLASMLEWSQAASHVEGCSSESGIKEFLDRFPAASLVLRRLLALQIAAGTQDHKATEDLLRDLFTKVLDSEQVVTIIGLLNSQGLAREGVAYSASLHWVARGVEQVSAGLGWYDVQTEAMASLLKCESLQVTNELEFAARLADWSLKMHGSSAFDATAGLGRLCSAAVSVQTKAVLRKAIRKCIASAGESSFDVACRVLDVAFGTPRTVAVISECGAAADSTSEGGAAKRRRVEGESGESTELLGEACCEWARGRLVVLIASSSWQRLQPAAIVAVASSVHGDAENVNQDDAKAMPELVGSWVRHADAAAVFEAIQLAAPCNNVMQAVLDAAKGRLVAVERQNAILEGGKFKMQMEKAVAAARAEDEERYRNELDSERAKLQNEFDEVRHKQFGELRQRFLGVLSDLESKDVL